MSVQLMKRILVIDDEAWLREMVHMALAHKGFDVEEADNGEMGIEKARKSLPDLVLCDVNMDKVDGYLTLSSLRNEPMTASIPFILMTGMADHAGMRHGMELGADDYLPKPFTIEALYAAVDARLRKTQALRQEAERKLADLRENISFMLPHELRTPLNGILGFGEILSADAGTLSSSDVAEMGQVIYESGKRLERLIENFLIYAQLELLATDPQKVMALRRKQALSPAALIREHATAQADLAGRGRDLVIDCADISLAICDEYLAKIVDELTQNSVKFSPAGTKVMITLSSAEGYGVLTVADRGKGFSPEQIAKVGAYMQFDRKMHEQQGLGLGLSIAQRLTELHAGSLTLSSERETGTRVTVRLPQATTP
jgi:two-component system, sensor histidine kinase and response regulator